MGIRFRANPHLIMAMVFFTFGLPYPTFRQRVKVRYFFLFDGCELRTSNMSYEAKTPPLPKKGRMGGIPISCGETLVT